MEKGVAIGNVSQHLLFFFFNFRLYKYFFLDYLILFDRSWLFTSFGCS